MIYEQLFLISLLLTILIETSVLFPLLYFFKIKRSKTLIIFSGILASTTTLPYLWFLFRYLITNNIQYHIFGESFVFLTEALIYYFVLKINPKHAILISLIANLISYGLGLLIFR